jgi:CRP-like cAMP-binding protein
MLPGGNTRAATVRARTDVSLLVLDRANFESLLGPLMPQLQAASKSYTGYKPKQGTQVTFTSSRMRRQLAKHQSRHCVDFVIRLLAQVATSCTRPINLACRLADGVLLPA